MWRDFTAAVAVAGAGSGVAGAASGLVWGRGLGEVVFLAGLGVVGVGGTVGGAVLAEDRAGAEPRALTAAWRGARRSAHSLERAAQRVPAGPLRDRMRAEHGALLAHLAGLGPRFEDLWGDLSDTRALKRQRPSAPAARAQAEALGAQRDADEQERVNRLVAELDDLASATRELTSAVDELGQLRRVQAVAPPRPAIAPAPEFESPLPEDMRALARSLREVHELGPGGG